MVSRVTAVCGGVAGLCLLTYLHGKMTAPGFRVAGKHVFITGGSSGLGLALAKEYARAGAKVSIVARGTEKLAAAKSEIESWKSSDVVTYPVFACPCDVTDSADVQQAVAKANAFHGRVTDHVVCNAGFFEPGLLIQQDVSLYRQSIDINFFGAVHTVKAALPAMVSTPLHPDEPKRRIIFVASIAGLTSFVGYATYSTAKYAMRGLSDALRNELQLYDIETSIFFPGKISTPMINREIPAKPVAASRIDSVSRMVPPEVAARALVNGIASGQYAITIDLLGELLRMSVNGVAPRNHTLLEALVLPVCALVQVPHRWYSDWIVRREAKV